MPKMKKFPIDCGRIDFLSPTESAKLLTDDQDPATKNRNRRCETATRIESAEATTTTQQKPIRDRAQNRRHFGYPPTRSVETETFRELTVFFSSQRYFSCWLFFDRKISATIFFRKN
jgi:hypothetical protein